MDCNKNCKQQGYRLSQTKVKVLLVVGQNEKAGTPLTKIPDIKSSMKITDRQAYYTVNMLVKEGWLERECGGVLLTRLSNKAKAYLTTQFGDLQLDVSYVSAFLDRAHRITIMQPIIQRGNRPEGFQERDTTKLNWVEPIYSAYAEDVLIEIKQKAIYYHFPKAHGIDAHQIVYTALTSCFRFAQTLKEDDWRLNLPETAVIQQEHAIFNEALGKLTRKYKIHYKSDRLTFDASIATNEFELTHPEHAPDDFVKLTDFLEAVVRGKIDTKELIAFLEKYKQNQQLIDKIE